MVSEWRLEKIGQYADVYSGFAFKSKDLSDIGDKGIPVVKIKNVNNKVVDLTDAQFFPEKLVEEKHDKYFLKDGDVLIAMTGQGSVGRVGKLRLQANQKVLMNQRVGRFVAKKNLDLSYFYYVVSSSYYEEVLFSAGTGSGQPNLSPDVIRKIEIPILPLPEQKAIAHVLGALDDRIELNRRMNETLEAMAQALFKSWFVDFDPVIDNALAAGKEIPAELSEKAQDRAALGDKRQPLPEEIRTLFPDEFSYSDELDWIPKGWEVKPIDEIAHFQNGLALQKFRPENEDNFLPVVKIAQLKAGVASSDEKASPDINPSCIIDNGDVIFSWSGSLMVDLWCGGKAALNQHLFKVTSENCPKWFYHLWAKYHLAVFQKIAADKAVTMGHIKRSHLKEALCIVPNIDLEKFDLIGKLVLKQIDSRLECTTLGLLRDTLLPKLLSGEVRIPDAEKMVEELAL